MRKTTLLAVFPALLFCCQPPAAFGQTVLQCSSPTTPENLGSFLVEPNTPGEAARMRQAPHAVRRVGKHLLLVDWRAGTRQFKDKPPYMEGTLDGLSWTYCGYSPEAGVHVIQRNDSDWLTGVLVDEKTGSILPGGFSVSFSPDLKNYMTREQEEGAELENVKLYTRAGRLLWSGHNGLLSRDGASVVAAFDDLGWNESGNLTAEFKDNEGRKRTLILKLNGNKRWNWSSSVSR
jgi:hypothetical protein